MKIAILLMNKGRGSGVVAKEHVEYLLEQGHEVYFVQPEVGQGIPGTKPKEVVLDTPILPVHEYLPSAKNSQKAVSSMEYGEAMGYLKSYENALEEIIEDLDLVVGHHANLSAIATANVSKRYNKPYVLFLHGTGIEPRHHGMYDDQVWDMIKESVEDANGIIVTTEYVRDELVRNMIDLPKDKFLIQPCGVNVKDFHPENTGNMKKKYNLPDIYVICPGALTELKGPQNVVEASKLYSDLAPTVFIGDGDLREELENKIEDRGQFLGFVSNEDKAQLINGATLLAAAPEKKEHFGIIYIEAMSGTTPVVAYEGGGVNSIVTADTGRLTPRDPNALGKAVRNLLEDEQERAIKAAESRKRAKDYYSTEILGTQLTDWLTEIVNGHNK